MFSRLLTIWLLCTGVFLSVSCGSSNPILNYQEVPTAGNSGTANLNNVQRAILTACARNGWQPKVAGNGHIAATKYLSGRIAVVDIHFSAETYSIAYRDSSNMGYDGTSINPLYNDWVESLNQEIRTKLSRT